MARVVVEVTGDTSGLSKALGSASKSANGFGSSMAKVGKIAALGLAVGVGVAAVAITKSVKAALDAEQAQTRLDAAFKHASTSAKQQQAALEAVNKVSVKSGLDDEALSDSLTRLTQVTGDAEKATTGMGLAADIARGRGIELEAATGIVTKAMLGNVGALKRIGIEIPKVTAAQDALKASHAKATEEQKKAAKAADDLATRQGALAALQAKFGGDAEAYGKTASGAMDRFKVAIENVKEGLGTALLPALAGAAGAAADFLDKFNNAEGASAKFGVVLDEVKTLASQAWTSLQAAFNAIDWGKVWATVAAGISAGTDAAAKALQVGSKWAGEIYKQISEALGKVDWSKVAEDVSNDLSKALDAAATKLRQGGGGGGTTSQSISKRFSDAIKNINWVGVVGGLAELNAALSLAWIKMQAGAVIGLAKAIGVGALAGAKAGWEKLWGFLEQIPGTIKNLFSGAGTWLYNAGLSILSGLWGGLKAKWNEVSGWLGGLGGRIRDLKGPPSKDAVLLTDIGKLIIQSLQTGMVSAWGPAEAWIGSLGGTMNSKMAAGVKATSDQVKEALTESVKKAVDAAAKQLENAKGQFSSAAGSLASGIQSAFSTLTGNQQTPAEKQLAAMDKAEKQKELLAAESAAGELLMNAQTAEEKAAANAAYAAAELAIQRYNLEQQAVNERVGMDAINVVKTEALQAGLEAWNTKLEEHKISYAAWHKGIMGLLQTYVPNWKTKGSELGEAFITALEKKIAEAAKVAKKLAEAFSINIKVTATAAQVEKAIAGARAAGGPVSGGKTYLVGENGPELFTAASSGRIIPNGGTARAGGGVVNNYFSFPNYVGSKQELIQMLKTETNRAASRNG